MKDLSFKMNYSVVQIIQDESFILIILTISHLFLIIQNNLNNIKEKHYLFEKDIYYNKEKNVLKVTFLECQNCRLFF